MGEMSTLSSIHPHGKQQIHICTLTDLGYHASQRGTRPSNVHASAQCPVACHIMRPHQEHRSQVCPITCTIHA